MEQTFDAVIKNYFSCDLRKMLIRKGDILLRQGCFNDRLFYVQDGLFVGYVDDEFGKRELFRVYDTQFLGLYSFFSNTFRSSVTVVAERDSIITYIDQDVKKDVENKGISLVELFMPVVVENLLQRQKFELEVVTEKESALKRLLDTQRLASLGQMAAGIAHELNNAISVLKRNSAWIKAKLSEVIDTHEHDYYTYFKDGSEHGRRFSSKQVRKRAREIAEDFSIDEDVANRLAQTSIDINTISTEQLRNRNEVSELLNFWEIGSAFYDMGIAARHAAHVVKSVRALAEKRGSRTTNVSVNESLRQALSLLSSPLRRIEVKLNLTKLPDVQANKGELVQVWLNLIKNAMESMASQPAEDSKLSISTELKRKKIVVEIKDNGPGIEPDLLPKIWQPDITTKEKGIEFGLGLGLTIVERIVRSYSGEVSVKSSPGSTVFSVVLPAHTRK